MELAKLKAFRQAVYNHLGAARDATFELTDAVLLTRNAYSLADLSLSPVFRRKWPSIYEALQDSRPQRNKLMKLYIEQMPSSGRPLIAVDHTCWQRPEAVTLQERTIEHSCTAVPGNRPIALAQGYSTIAWIPEASGSWALPLRHERITSWENPIDKGAWQQRQVCRHLLVRPISLWDCEYGCAPFVLKTADIPADKLVRLRSNLCVWGAPPRYSGKGRPRIHGDKFKLNDSQTWGEADETLEVDDPKLGRVLLRLWKRLHFRQAALINTRVAERIFMALNRSKAAPTPSRAPLSSAESERLSLNSSNHLRKKREKITRSQVKVPFASCQGMRCFQRQRKGNLVSMG
jgi:hypothetical protein